jgi:hypothetical protein
MLVKQSASFIRVVAVCTRPHSESIVGTIKADVFHVEQLNAIVDVEGVWTRQLRSPIDTAENCAKEL